MNYNLFGNVGTDKSIELLYGDCLDLMISIPNKSVDLILCDLPYGTTCCAWDVVIPFDQLWGHYERIIKDNGAIVLFSAQPFTAVLASSNLNLFRYEWIYEKPAATGFLNAKRQPLRAHENVLVFYKKQPTYNPQKTFGHARKKTKRKHVGSECYGKTLKLTEYDSSERYPRSIQAFNSDKQRNSLHPTQKPVSICEYLINTYTNQGDLVLDNCMGSGTTGVACVNTNRKFIGIEKNAEYFEIAQNRILGSLQMDVAV
ncbi:DNA-methyltransferase [Acinetobacter colistiniresistens]|uniref:Methyltransferase n=1 Tax=Acinetobacter colistiniresistens TaxID=280145 RepID=A0A558FB55_9GAMM|nr:site-specific DNA-methyltransferase [Acinetobacter colistiniresistens]TVT82736.1 site-specific DNA-methyltransferase [Acinetobacter colistiniresistens]